MASIYKRDWTAKDGTKQTAYLVQIYVEGKKVRKQFATKRAAQQFANSGGVGRLQAKSKPQAAGLLVSTIAERWLLDSQEGRNGREALEPETLVYYRGHWQNHIEPEFGSSPIQSVTAARVRAFRDRLLRSDLNRNTVRKILTSLRTMMASAVENEALALNPAAEVRVHSSQRHATRVQIHSKNEVRRMLETARRLAEDPASDPRRKWARAYPLLLVLLYAGLRVSEVRGLRREDVDLVRSTITVHQRADKRGRLGSPKSSQGRRRVHIPEVCRVALGAYMETHPHRLVFATKSGRPLDTANIRTRIWGEIQAREKTEIRNLHSARHFFASRQIESGANLKELCDVIGHADPAFTMRVYGHLFQDAEANQKRMARAEALVL